MSNDPFDRKKYLPEHRPRFMSPEKKKSGLSAKQIAEKRVLERFLRLCALDAGIRLKKVVVKDVPQIEVLFDVHFEGSKVCYLLKQWNDSILRLGDHIKLRRDFKDFKERLLKIHHICGVNYFSIMFPPADKKDSRLQMVIETPVYLENLNERVFFEAVYRFKKGKDSLQKFLK